MAARTDRSVREPGSALTVNVVRVPVPTGLLVDAFDHLEKEHPGMRSWPAGDPRIDRALAGYVAYLIERDLKASK